MTDDLPAGHPAADRHPAGEAELLAAWATDRGEGAGDEPVLQLTRGESIDHWVTTASGAVYRLVWDPTTGSGFRMRRPYQSKTLPGYVGIQHLRDGLPVGVVDVVDLTLGRDMVLTLVRIDEVPVTIASTPVVSIRRVGGERVAGSEGSASR